MDPVLHSSAPPTTAPAWAGAWSRDGLGGCLVILFGAVTLWLNARLDFGTAGAMGPGFMPRIIAICLILSGAAIVLGAALRREPSVSSADLAAAPWRGLVTVGVSIGVFALILQPAGLFVAGFVLLAGCSLANPKFKPVETLGFSLVTSLVVTALFAWGLKVPVPVWPTF